MDHPVRHLNARELRNWEIWLRANPDGPRAEGSFDSARTRRGIDIREFRVGGAFDEGASEEEFDRFLTKLARSLDEGEWATLRRTLLAEGANDDESTEEEEDRPKAMDSFLGRFPTAAANPTRSMTPRYSRPAPAAVSANGEFLERFPGAKANPTRRV
jgi:hypothetical protein